MQEALLDRSSFLGDPHAARYLSTLERHPAAFDRLLDLLNRPETDRQLTGVRAGEPALAGIVEQLEDDDAIGLAIAEADDSLRFRQAVGVAVRLRMEQLGWHTTGKTATVSRSSHFGKAARYEPDERTPQERARAALRRVREIGTQEEQAESGRILMEALAETRRAAGRPF